MFRSAVLLIENRIPLMAYGDFYNYKNKVCRNCDLISERVVKTAKFAKFLI